MDNLAKLLDISAKELEDTLNLADQLKYEQKHGIPHKVLEGKTLAMLFRRQSLRARISFEVGMTQLGGSSVFMSADDITLGKAEPVEDTARVISRFCDGIVTRDYPQSEVEDLVHYGTIPVINAQSEFASPCRALADLMTVREFKGRLDGLKICFVGAGIPVMNSVIIAALKARMNVAIACPEGFDPDAAVLDYAAKVGHFEMYRDPRGAARGADAILTCRWTQEDEPRAYNLLRGFTINQEVMRYAKPDAIVIHGLPARREEEITAEILEEHSIEIFEAVENRLHVQKALMSRMMAKEKFE